MESKNNKYVYELLKKKEIYEILDGDTHFQSKINGKDIAMPYLTGKMLANILHCFGIHIEYDLRSRWMYLEELFDFCIKKNSVSEIFEYFFSVERFREKLQGLTSEDIRICHNEIVQGAIGLINGELYFEGYELKTFAGKYVLAMLNDNDLDIVIPAIQKVDRIYIKEIAKRAESDISHGDFDSAITKARTLLEETFIYVIEQKKESPNKSGNINKLYNQTKNLYNMHSSAEMDKRVNKLLSGLEKTVSAVAEMRNKNSDAHGLGSNRLAIADYHARLAVNAAINMADFILAVAFHANENWE